MRLSFKPRWARRRAVVLASAVLSVAAEAGGQTWIGGGGSANTNWSDNANWNSVPVNNGTANIVFSTAGTGNSTVDSNWSVNSLKINAASPAWVLGNSGTGQLTIGAGGVTGPIGLALPITLGAHQTWNAGSGTIGTLTGMTLNLNGFNLTTNDASGKSITLTNITGSGGITQIGSGFLDLVGTSTYSATTNVSNGYIGVSSNAALGQTGAPVLMGNAAAPSTGTVQFQAAFDPSVAHPITLSNGGGAFDTARYNITFAGALNGTGPLTVEDSVGGGSLALTQASSQSSTIVSSGGMLSISNPASLGPSSSQLVLFNGTLRLTTSMVLNQPITSALSGAMIDVTPGSTVTLTGGIVDTSTLTVTDSGTLVLDNTSTTGGNINVSGGAVLATASNAQLSTGKLTLNGGTFRALSGPGLLDPTLNGSLFVGPGTGSIDTNSTLLTFSRSVTGNGSLFKIGLGTLTLNAVESYTGATAVSGGTLQAGVNNLDPSTTLYVGSPGIFNLNGHNQLFTALVGNGTVSLANATLSLGSSGLDGTFYGSIGGTGSLVIVNNGGTALGGVNSFAGNINVANGFLTVYQASSLGATGSGVLLGQSSSNSYLVFGGAFDPSASHPISIGSFGGTIDTFGNNITFANSIGGTGALSVMDSIGQSSPAAGGSLTLQSSGTQSTTTLLSGGKLIISNDNSLGTSSAALNFSGGTLATTSNLLIDQTVNVTANNGTVDVAPGTTLFAGPITGSGTLIKSDSGTLQLMQNIAAGFNVAGGTLMVQPTTNVYAAVLVSTGGTLVIGAPSANYSSLLYPTVANLTVANGGIAIVSPASGNNTRTFRRDLVINSTLALGSTSTLDLAYNDMLSRNMSIGQMNALVQAGYNSGKWNGAGGIVSSTAAADTTHLTALGVVLNNFITNQFASATTQLYTTFEGYPALSSDVLVKFTYYGDENLDGKVDGSDYSRVDFAFGYNLLPASVKTTSYPFYPQFFTGWFNGDFNYDGVVDGSDYTLMDNVYNQQGPQVATALATPTSVIGGNSSAVPEPIGLPVICGAVLVLGRRRRSKGTGSLPHPSSDNQTIGMSKRIFA